MAKQLIIKGIESCSDCPMFNGYFDECWHKDSKKKYITDKEFETMPQWCPLPEGDK